MTVIERFLKLVSFDTTSSEESGQYPSTPNQKVLGAELVRQMQELGIQDARMDAFGYVYGTIPANCEKNLPVYGLIAHMDTSPDAPGGPIRARITETYEGGDIILNEEHGIASPAPALPSASSARSRARSSIPCAMPTPSSARSWQTQASPTASASISPC